LQGAFANPGSINGKPGDKPKAGPQSSGTGDEANFPKEGRENNFSSPIKNELIGTDKDAQLQAALDYLEKNPGSTTGAAAQ
jgi:hypothetical protein